MTRTPTPQASTGIEGLDNVLAGGLPEHRVYLVQGPPGAGKTTLALQFLLDAAQRGESTLYVTLSETTEELRAAAGAHGWSLDRIASYELGVVESHEEEENTLYLPSTVELGERMRALLAEIDRVAPTRVVIDSCSELRLLAQTPLRFRRQILALKKNLAARACTLLLLDNCTPATGDVLLQSLVHGVIELEHRAPIYGAERRRLRVLKLREVAFRGGFHDFVIRAGGLTVFPRLVAAEHQSTAVSGAVESGIDELDRLMGGGLARGTGTLIVGPAGTGKSSLAMQYASAAADRGEAVAMFAFDERPATITMRARAFGSSLETHLASGLVTLAHVDPAELSPGELVGMIRRSVEERGVRVVVLDSLNGFMNAMANEEAMGMQLHELLGYLGQKGVATIMVFAQHGLFGHLESAVDISYIADTVVLLRYFEASGLVRKAISVLKKRSGRHEAVIREYRLDQNGLSLGPPLMEFRGVLGGVPEYTGAVGAEGPLMEPSR
jgi:circadian clock protein KaiC